MKHNQAKKQKPMPAEKLIRQSETIQFPIGKIQQEKINAEQSAVFWAVVFAALIIVMAIGFGTAAIMKYFG